MPEFHDSLIARAPVEEVWKLLYDPTRFPQWWQGVGSVDDIALDHDTDPAVEPGTQTTGYTMYPEDYPDFPMPQLLGSDCGAGTVTISCLVSDLRFEWRLQAVESGTEISAHVRIPEAEARRLADQATAVRLSLRRLADLAAAPPP